MVSKLMMPLLLLFRVWTLVVVLCLSSRETFAFVAKSTTLTTKATSERVSLALFLSSKNKNNAPHYSTGASSFSPYPSVTTNVKNGSVGKQSQPQQQPQPQQSVKKRGTSALHKNDVMMPTAPFPQPPPPQQQQQQQQPFFPTGPTFTNSPYYPSYPVAPNDNTYTMPHNSPFRRESPDLFAPPPPQGQLQPYFAAPHTNSPYPYGQMASNDNDYVTMPNNPMYMDSSNQTATTAMMMEERLAEMQKRVDQLESQQQQPQTQTQAATVATTGSTPPMNYNSPNDPSNANPQPPNNGVTTTNNYYYPPPSPSSLSPYYYARPGYGDGRYLGGTGYGSYAGSVHPNNQWYRERPLSYYYYNRGHIPGGYSDSWAGYRDDFYTGGYYPYGSLYGHYSYTYPYPRRSRPPNGWVY